MKNIRISLLILSILLLGLESIQSQNGLYSILKNFNDVPTRPNKMTAYHEVQYNTYTLDTTRTAPDTILIIDGQKFELYKVLEEKRTFTASNKGNYIAYGQMGEVTHRGEFSFGKNGKMDHFSIVSEDPQMAQFINSDKIFEYDDNDRVTRISSNGIDLFKGSYFNNGMIDSYILNTGIMDEMEIKAEKIGDTLRYEPDLTSMINFFKEMGMPAEEFPKEYTDVLVSDVTFHIMEYKENEETKELELISKVICDHNLNILEEMRSQYGFTSTARYKYNNDKQILQKEIESPELKIKEYTYDNKGQLIIEPLEYEEKHYSYDKYGNVISTLNILDGKILSAVLLTNIKY